MTLDESARRFVDHPSTGVAVVRLVRALVSEGWNSPQIAMLCAAAAGLCATAAGTGARDEWVETLQAVIGRVEGREQARLDVADGRESEGDGDRLPRPGSVPTGRSRPLAPPPGRARHRRDGGRDRPHRARRGGRRPTGRMARG